MIVNSEQVNQTPTQFYESINNTRINDEMRQRRFELDAKEIELVAGVGFHQ